MLHTYQNGNVTVTIDDITGTKTRFTEEDEFRPEFAENCDVTISHKCDNGCPYCYLGCTKDGEFGKLLDLKVWDSLHPYTELAFNLNFPLHPELIPWLIKLRQKKVLANATINQNHFETYEPFIRWLLKAGLIHGIGISLREVRDEFIQRVKMYPTAVIHVIVGATHPEDIAWLAYNHMKVLILGYKDFGFGSGYLTNNSQSIQDNIDWLSSGLMELIPYFDVVSFDNKAIDQLNLNKKLSSSVWEHFYQGEEGSQTFAIDTVTNTFSVHSSSADVMSPIRDNIDEMFKLVQEKVNGSHY